MLVMMPKSAEASMVKILKEDGEEILKFMVSNGLVANPQKTTLLI